MGNGVFRRRFPSGGQPKNRVLPLTYGESRGKIVALFSYEEYVAEVYRTKEHIEISNICEKDLVACY